MSQDIIKRTDDIIMTLKWLNKDRLFLIIFIKFAVLMS